MKLLPFIFLLVSLPAFAGGLLPSLDNTPIIWSNDPRFTEATKNLQKALLRQLGITQAYEKVNNYVSKEANYYGQAVQDEVADDIDTYTPLHSEDVFSFIGVVYVVGVKHHVTKSFKDPWWPKITHSIDLSTTCASTGVQIPF